MNLRDELSNLMDSGYSFGMDIGTSSCYVAYKEGGVAPKIPDYPLSCRGGIPSLAWCDKDGKEWFCDQVEDKQGLVEDPAGVWSSGKMKLGEEKVVLNGHSYSPRQLMIREVRRVLRVSEEALEAEMIEMDPKEWVVGIPARFEAREKGEMMHILTEATGGKKIRLVLEPILAAVANDFYLKRAGKNPRRVLVMDMGGGTLDVVMLVPNENPTVDEPHPYIALHPDGLREAGDAMDEIMVNLILDKLRSNPSRIRMEILENKMSYDRRHLPKTAKETKERLSSVDSCAVNISGMECGNALIQVTRAEYEDRIRPMLQRAVDLAASVLEKCQLGPKPDIDILLVGGATYTPLLRTLVKKKFSWLGEMNILQRFPEKAVALGAAIYAQTPELVRPKVAYGYAVNTYVKNGREEVLRVIIPSGADLPMTITANFQTLDEDQRAVRFNVYEVSDTTGRVHMDMNSGRITAYSVTHRFSTRVPKGTSVRLTTTLSEDGVLITKVEDFRPEKRITEKLFTMTNTLSV